MGIQLKQCYLHLLDTYNCKFIPANKPMDELNEGAYHFVETNIKKCAKNTSTCPGVFEKHSGIRQSFLDYRNQQLSFEEFGQKIAEKRYQSKVDYEIFTISSLFICEVEIDDIEYVVGLEIKNKEGMVYTSKTDESGVKNDVEVQSLNIPAATLGNSSFFMLNKDDLSIMLWEKPVVSEGAFVYPYATEILECQTEFSVKEALQNAKEVAQDVAKKHSLDKLTMIPILERVIAEVINEGEDLNFNDVAEEVFHENQEAKDAYIKGIAFHGIKKPIQNRNRAKLPLQKMQKIKTNHGIEIKIPLDYYNNKDFIEIITDNEGRQTIQLKNIDAIEN